MSDLGPGLGRNCGPQQRVRQLMHEGGSLQGALRCVPMGLELHSTQGVEGGPVPPSCLLRLLMAAAPQCPASPGGLRSPAAPHSMPHLCPSEAGVPGLASHIELLADAILGSVVAGNEEGDSASWGGCGER